MHHLINHTLFNIVNKEQLFTSENKDLNCKAIHLVAKMNDLNSHLAMWYLDHHHQQALLSMELHILNLSFIKEIELLSLSNAKPDSINITPPTNKEGIVIE
mgnify:CR=1 FL=1